MGFKFTVLWTDALVYLLIAMIAVFIIAARRKEHLRAPWREVARNSMAMGTLVILLAYVFIGLLDSLHFRVPLPGSERQIVPVEYSIDVQSVLDLALAQVKDSGEKTYSAPFATQLYAKETIERADGTQERVYPRLKYGGADLQDPETQRGYDIAVTSGRALLEGLLAWSIVTGLILTVLTIRRRKAERRRQKELAHEPVNSHQESSFPAAFSLTFSAVFKGATDVPWRVILLTLGVLTLLAFWAAELSGHYHIFGTDKVGQDVFYQTLKSIRTGLIIGTLTTLVALPFAVLLGIMAGYFRGRIDDIVQYVYTTLGSIPSVLLIAASVLILQAYMDNHAEFFDTVALRADARLLFLCIILGITSWTGLCRLLRGETLKLRELDYIQAAQAFGVGHFKIIARHILPNVMHIVLISIVLDFSGLVLAEAVLSYVGVGVDPSTLSWGNMINSARLEMAREPLVWWPLLAAFVFMFTLVLAANLFSDTVRDAFDPRLRKL